MPQRATEETAWPVATGARPPWTCVLNEDKFLGTIGSGCRNPGQPHHPFPRSNPPPPFFNMADAAFVFPWKQAFAVTAKLKSLPLSTREKGITLVGRHAVKRMWRESQTVLMGKVQGSYLYTQTIRFHGNKIAAATCSCPVGSSCKHVAALLFIAQVDWKGPGKDVDGIDIDYVGDDDLDEGDDNVAADAPDSPPPALSSPAKTRKTSKKAAPSPSPTAAAPEPIRLAQIIARNLGRSLDGREKQRCNAIEDLFKNDTPQVNVDMLLVLAGRPPTYRYTYDPPLTLWPRHRPPSNAIEAFYYVAYAFKKTGHISPDSLFAAVPWAEVQILVAPWQREESINHWQKQLSAFNQAPVSLTPPSPSFRLRLTPLGAQIEWRPASASLWLAIKVTALRQYANVAHGQDRDAEFIEIDDDAANFLRATCPREVYQAKNFLEKDSPQFTAALNRLLRNPTPHHAAVVNEAGQPIAPSDQTATWILTGPHFPVLDAAATPEDFPDTDLNGDYTISVRGADGLAIPDVISILPGQPNLVLTTSEIHPLVGAPLPSSLLRVGSNIPIAAVESPAGLAALDRLGIPHPPRVAHLVKTVKVAIVVRCAYLSQTPNDIFKVQATSTCGGLFPDETWQSGTWRPLQAPPSQDAAPPTTNTLTRLDRSLQHPTHSWLTLANLHPPDYYYGRVEYWSERHLKKSEKIFFPDEFLDWLDHRPEGIVVELDSELASLRDKGQVTGHFALNLEPSGIDWFDLQLNLQLSDIELTPQDIELLIKNTGSWVRLPKHGWRRLEFDITEENCRELADLGLSPRDLHAPETQRLHVLQLAHPASSSLLPAETATEVRRRASELRTSVAPALPSGITATLRPYQLEGFHFLAYLSTNHFGGILADDMGLGKTLQALAWIAWLHESDQLDGKPLLVVCPKSVQDNWTSEAAKFYPALPVRQWTGASAGDLSPFSGPAPSPPGKTRRKKTAPAGPPPLLIINYTQLRLHADAISTITWSTVILDEAQYIKNPTSITAKTAFALNPRHRLALSGTPIENRLLDLWSIMAFAMPGILGNRATFAKNFGAKDDPLARRRLGARVRPFLLRRTKKEVAADLPDRIEEDLICELEGPQRDHYLAELKHARSTLLKASTPAQLDKLRFNILTSLLRLRQICCHPVLTGKGLRDSNSAKLETLMELLEPLIEEGHKVLIFSQFVEMLRLISEQLESRSWPHLLLTGATEDRGALVRSFQESAGANLFLISLKAGGSGLNLTAASYVVLFDPWWNPAVENQAIDRTHRIGQVNKVIAYRLITRDTIEEKIRHLQKAKSDLASDILGEETFAKALTLDDFQFLLGS